MLHRSSFPGRQPGALALVRWGRVFHQATAELLALLPAGHHAPEGVIAALAGAAAITFDLGVTPSFLVAINSRADLVGLSHFIAPGLNLRGRRRVCCLCGVHPKIDKRHESGDKQQDNSKHRRGLYLAVAFPSQILGSIAGPVPKLKSLSIFLSSDSRQPDGKAYESCADRPSALAT